MTAEPSWRKHYPPVKKRISKLIQAIVDSGAKLVLDGRQIAVSKYMLGNFIGPTILSDVKEDIECSKEEILGPVLLCMQANSIDEAINFVNHNKKYCYGTSIFTGSGALARKFQIEIETRQVQSCLLLGISMSMANLVYTFTPKVTQQWKEFPSSEGGLPTLMSDCPQSNDGLSQGLQALSYQSGDGEYQSGDGISQGLQSIGNYRSGGASLGLQSRDFSNGDGSPSGFTPEGFPGL